MNEYKPTQEQIFDAGLASAEYAAIRKAHIAYSKALYYYFKQPNIGDKTLDQIVKECNELPALSNITDIQGKAKTSMVTAAVSAKLRYWIDSEIHDHGPIEAWGE